MTWYFGQSFACASSGTMCVCKMCVECGPFNRGEELVFAGVQEVPAERHSAKVWIRDYGAVAVVLPKRNRPVSPGR